MKRFPCPDRWGWWVVAALAVLGWAAAGWPQSGLRDLYRESLGAERFVLPDPASLEQANRLFLELLQTDGPVPESLEHDGEALGFEVIQRGREADRLLVLREGRDKSGRGFYVFRRGGRPAALMIPHGMKDYKTGKIGLQLFLEGDFTAGAWNTAPRYRKGERDRTDWDLAHLEGTYFTAFTRAFARAQPVGRLVQIHGFAAEKRDTEAGASAELIASSGSPLPSPGFLALIRCLKASLDLEVRVYPLDVRELGGTTNASGRILRSLGHAGFVHLEFAYPVRKRLLQDAPLRENLIRCLEESP